MTKKKSNKRALLMSALALLMCVSMFIGSTFAWFTDSVTSGSNVIKSGNLDIDVQYTLDGTTWKDLAGATDLFQKGLWEPGHTEVVALRIKNNGTLALKYVAYINNFDEETGLTKDGREIRLSEILEVSTLVQQVNDIGDVALSLAFNGENSVGYEHTAKFEAANILRNDVQLLPGDAHYMFIKVDMPETVGNEANHNGVNIPQIYFGINVLATQYTSEYDSFGNQYDAGAQYPEVMTISADAVMVKTLEELTAAFTNGGKYWLGADIDVSTNLTVAADTVLCGIEPYKLTFSNDSKITVNADTALTLYGVHMDGGQSYSFENGSIQYDADARRTHPLLNAGAGSELVLGQGTVIENVVAKGSAVVSATGTDANRVTVQLEGATIRNCAGESGAIINVNKAGDVVIGDGTLITNNASYNNNNHGIIRVYNAWDAANPSTVTMNGGEVSGNYYSGNGMIGLYYGKMIMNGGRICNNTWFEDNQKNNGWYPVVYVHSNSQLVVNGGEISGNTVKYGVINSLNSSVVGALTINGGTITNNVATNNNDQDAFAVVKSKASNSLVVSDEANVTGTVWVYYDAEGNKDQKFYSLEEYFGN